ncbi:hypothetical protein M422DRAFT_102988, partial [Sphaerobolus stellatus SS14]
KTDKAKDAAEQTKERATEIPWAKHLEWMFRLIDYIEQHPDFRRSLFSDSTKVANSEGRKKKVGKDQKQVAYGVLAEYIF